ncbi:MAG: substrate-binding domain-containing protein [Prevotellaceae bacterium]|jgi:phosphate transport system substrate-binding protein|nr:substrate-binding domain-containing protein [Prevotellaceae bacterium]
MKNFTFIFVFAISLIAFSNCEKPVVKTTDFKIEGLTVENFPKIDGSTSNGPLISIIVCKLLGWDYEWSDGFNGIREIRPNNTVTYTTFLDLTGTSETHNAIWNLIDGRVDIIFSARKISADEKQYADSKSVALIETPIALDAFIFLINASNPVNSLTHNQIIDIYTGQITNWNEVGGNNNTMHPYVRNQNSGSQELMESVVMQGTPIAEFDIDYEPTIWGMMPVYYQLKNDENGICYIVYYFHEKMIVDEVKTQIKTIAINGITANSETIKNETYPYLSPVYVSIRSDLDKNSNAYKLYELMQTAAGKAVIEKSGYVVK